MKITALPTLREIDADLERRATLRAHRQQQLAAYHDDPARFVQECFMWGHDEHPFPYQIEGLRRLVAKRRIAIRSPHSAGKTCLAAWAVIWFALTRDLAGEDWKVPTTASVGRQLEEYLWPEIAIWARRLDWLKIGRDPFTPRELQTQALDLQVGRAFALSSDDPGRMEGAHASQLLYVFDEAKMIPSNTWDAVEGAFAGRDYCLALAISTPGEPQGRFYEIQSRKPGYEDWDAMHITVDEMLAAGRQDAAWVAQRERQWGRGSAVFQNRVLGEFAASEAEGIIPLAWVEAAIERWRQWRARVTGPVPLTAIGLDVARTGEDQTIAACRSEWVITEFRRPHNKADVMETTGLMAGLLQLNPEALGIIDLGGGWGTGPCDRLRELGFRVMGFVPSARALIKDEPAMDRTGELGFVNLRAAAWWWMREILDPDAAHPLPVALPDDPELIGELTAPHYRQVSGGRIQVEDKDEIRKRLGRSPDRADAVVMAFADKFAEPISEPVSLWGGGG